MAKQILNVMRAREGQDGKTYWDRVGVLVQDSDKCSIHLDVMPVGEWNGWLQAFRREEESQQGQGQGQGQSQTPARDYDDQDVEF
jgi:hypothetical protein